MNRIRLLPEQVANQIAAGEVVERPASVVKELVENAIDAGATRIEIEIESGGRALVRVADNGCGMNRDDALLCLERHATSKIVRAEDLAAIRTLGFRGEAIPSIASVSRFTLLSRERDPSQSAATLISIQGGKVMEVREAPRPTGTTIEVRQLFYNLPARRKFLRAEETERSHIQHYLSLVALAHPEVAIHFTNDDRSIWRLPAEPDIPAPRERLAGTQRRWRALYGGGDRLLELDFTGSIDLNQTDNEPATLQARVWGLIGAPGVSRSTRENQHLFVNRRPVQNLGLNHALIEGYHTALMKGRFPVCCLFIEIDPAEVDVNIHPAKREVKFHHDRALRRFVAEAVRDVLLQFHSLAPAPPAAALPIAATALPPSVAPLVKPAADWFSPTAAIVAPIQAPLPIGFAAAGAVAAQLATRVPQVAAQTSSPLLAIELRLVGVIGRLYVLFESDRGLVIMDQHAAHERVLFEQMLDRMERHEVASQRLLLPETVELPPRDAAFLTEQLPVLAKLGVGLTVFGERTFLLDSLPEFVRVRDSRRFAFDLVDALKSAGQGINSMRLGEDMVIKTVCRHAVKANDRLADEELEKLLSDLRLCRMPYTCPHGRPTLIEFSMGDLEKRFGRQQ
ncbi:MAG: DNA mismatch repair endonuclease MutL [Verrucomicrobiae bacterium]|nr:DNA mismatch repair endonuclease MutL [Verrucomicrobiae bacterium]